MDRTKWEYKKLGEVCTVVSGSTPKTQIENYWNGIHYWITPAELDGSAYVSKSERLITDLAIEKTNLTLMPVGTVLLSSRAPIGKVAITTVPMFCNQGFKNLICSDSVHNKYLYWFLKGKTVYLNTLGRGATFKEISKTIVENIKIPIYPFEEQQRIAAELDCLNEMIALKQEQLKELDKLAQAIFYEMFGDGYVQKSLGEFCEVGTGSTPNRKKERIYYGGNIHWVKTTEVQNNDIFNTEETITEIALEQTNCKIYPIGTILMAMYGQGKTRGQVARLMIEAATNQACAAIVPNEKECERDFLYENLLLSYEKIRGMARGGNQANLNLQLVKSIQVPLPPLPLQQQFAEKISAIEAQKELVRKSMAEAQALLDYTMDKYFG